MDKPVMKRDTAVVFQDEKQGIIRFFAPRIAVMDFSNFGEVRENGQAYFLEVDGRFDFAEVVDYIKTWEQPE